MTVCGYSLRNAATSALAIALGEMVAMPVTAAYVADLAPANMRERFMGVYGLVWALALTLGPGMGMKLFAFGPCTLCLGCGALGLLAALIIGGKDKKPA